MIVKNRLLTPFYWSEVRFYKFVLSINWRRGRKLINQGVLVPDAISDNRPLFLSDGQSIARHKAAIADYHARKRAKPL